MVKNTLLVSYWTSFLSDISALLFSEPFMKVVLDYLGFYEHDTGLLLRSLSCGFSSAPFAVKPPFISPPPPILSAFHFAFFQPACVLDQHLPALETHKWPQPHLHWTTVDQFSVINILDSWLTGMTSPKLLDLNCWHQMEEPHQGLFSQILHHLVHIWEGAKEPRSRLYMREDHPRWCHLCSAAADALGSWAAKNCQTWQISLQKPTSFHHSMLWSPCTTSLL